MTKKIFKSLTIAASVAVAVSANAQDGILDVTFGSSGIVQTLSTHEAFDMLIQPDNKIIVVGSINMGSGNDDIAVVRYNSDGSLDNSFGTNGIVNVDFNGKNDDASSVALQSDGKIVVVGRAQNASNNNSDIAVIRLTSNGTLDNSFATNGKYQLDVDGFAGDLALDVALQTDGKIVFVGKAGGPDWMNKNAVIRLNANGTLDNTFDGDGIVKSFTFAPYNISELSAVTIQNDGKIIISGSKNNKFSVARLNSDGSLDSTFATNGAYTTSSTVLATSNKIYIQNDGKILGTYYHPTNKGVEIVRLNQNGTEDSGFGTNGTVTTQIDPNSYHYATDIITQPNGKIIVTGSLHNGLSIDSDYLVIRYNSNGTIDNTFGPASNGIVATSVAPNDEDRGKTVKLQSDGKIVVAGSTCTGSCDFVLLRYNNSDATTGVADNSIFPTNPVIFPNPANDFVTVSNLPKGSAVSILDITGKVIYNSTIKDEKTRINTTDFVNGVYILQVSNNGSIATTKLVVNK
jgi:uncharacterized delta-60 repeat protein